MGSETEKVSSQRLDRASMALFLAPLSSSGFSSVLGVEVDDARDISWRCCFMASALLDN
jgi:hypothetical protein